MLLPITPYIVVNVYQIYDIMIPKNITVIPDDNNIKHKYYTNVPYILSKQTQRNQCPVLSSTT